MQLGLNAQLICLFGESQSHRIHCECRVHRVYSNNSFLALLEAYFAARDHRDGENGAE